MPCKIARDLLTSASYRIEVEKEEVTTTSMAQDQTSHSSNIIIATFNFHKIQHYDIWIWHKYSSAIQSLEKKNEENSR